MDPPGLVLHIAVGHGDMSLETFTGLEPRDLAEDDRRVSLFERVDIPGFGRVAVPDREMIQEVHNSLDA